MRPMHGKSRGGRVQCVGMVQGSWGHADKIWAQEGNMIMPTEHYRHGPKKKGLVWEEEGKDDPRSTIYGEWENS
jgi:threonine dehydrogenase-like Zn-dependent dehydrogenase